MLTNHILLSYVYSVACSDNTSLLSYSYYFYIGDHSWYLVTYIHQTLQSEVYRWCTRVHGADTPTIIKSIMLLSAALAETTISAKCYKTMFTNNATEDTIKTTLLILRCTYNVISTTAPYFSEITHTKKVLNWPAGLLRIPTWNRK